MARYIFAVDPGLATGVALVDCSNPDEPFVVWSLELTTTQFYAKIEEVFQLYYAELELVVEDFHMLSGDKSEAPWSLNLIGICEFFCWRYGVKFTKQSPGRKPFAFNDRLRLVGFWHVGGEGHANDALRHAMIYHADHYPRWARKLIVPTD